MNLNLSTSEGIKVLLAFHEYMSTPGMEEYDGTLKYIAQSVYEAISQDADIQTVLSQQQGDTVDISVVHIPFSSVDVDQR
jgi:hypothetical protein